MRHLLWTMETEVMGQPSGAGTQEGWLAEILYRLPPSEPCDQTGCVSSSPYGRFT